MQLETGLVIIELAPFMSPINVRQFTGLIKDGFYDGLDFYRVIDGFVAQGGDVTQSRLHEHAKQLPAELTRAYNGSGNADHDPFVLVQSGEFMAPQTGFLNGLQRGATHQPTKSGYCTARVWLHLVVTMNLTPRVQSFISPSAKRQGILIGT